MRVAFMRCESLTVIRSGKHRPRNPLASTGLAATQVNPPAAALIPGVLFSASMDGFMRAYDPATGKVIWSVDTGREYEAINGVPTKGGSIKGAGPTVVDGWLYFGSGYGRFGMPGNAFLAFGPKE